MASVIQILPASLPVPAAAGGVSAAVDVRDVGGNLTAFLNASDGDSVAIDASPDGVTLWTPFMVAQNNVTVRQPPGVVAGFIRVRRIRVDPTPGGGPTAPNLSLTGQPLPSGYMFNQVALPVPAADGVGAAVSVAQLGITNEVSQSPTKALAVSNFDNGDQLIVEGSTDGNAPWVAAMQLQPLSLQPFPGSFGFLRVRRQRIPAAGPRIGVDGATCAFMGQGVTAAAGGGFDITQFGAIVDGVHDDAPAILAALAAAGTGGKVTAPPGVIAIGQSIVFAGRLGGGFFGAGKRATQFKWIGADNGVMFDIQGSRECEFSGFAFDGNGHAGITAIKYNGVNPNVSTKNTFREIMIGINNATAYGIRIGQVAFQCDQSDYYGLELLGCTVAGVSIEDANAVAHSFYSCQFQQCALGITSNNAGTGGAFNLTFCVFKSNTVCDIQTYPGSRGYAFIGCMAETGAIFLQMPAASTNTDVELIGCSVNGSSSVGPHIRAGAGGLNIIGGKYTAAPTGPFVIDVGNLNGDTAKIAAICVNFADGNPFTGANIAAFASIYQWGCKFAGIHGDAGDVVTPRSQWDTAGLATIWRGMRAGIVNALAGKTSGDVTFGAADGPDGTAGLAAGNGGNTFHRSGGPGINNGGGAGAPGNLYLMPGNAAGTGNVFVADGAGVNRGQWLPGGTSWLFPIDDLARKLGASANRFLAFFVRLIAQEVGAAIASAGTIAPTRAIHHITGNTAIVTITPPADLATTGNGGKLTLIFDAVCTWTAAGNIQVAGTNTTAGTAVDFVYDNTAAKWFPLRTA